MKRFQNILVVYDIAIGAEETLDKALKLAQQNHAYLTVLHVVEDTTAPDAIVTERCRLMARLFNGVDLPPGQLNVIVRAGHRVEEILNQIQKRNIDLIVAPTEEGDGLKQLLGMDVTAELMRRSSCPIWTVRPRVNRAYRRIVAAVNAGKEQALSCPANRRILEMASSLAQREHASLTVLYVWQHTKGDLNRLSSELHDDQRGGIEQAALDKATQQVKDLIGHVIGPAHDVRALALEGDVEDVILSHIAAAGAELLVTEGSPGNPIVNAVVGNTTLRILHQVQCSVLISRPDPTVLQTSVDLQSDGTTMHTISEERHLL